VNVPEASPLDCDANPLPNGLCSFLLGSLADLCPSLRTDNGKRTRENQALFTELALLFPDRKKKSVIDCAMRVMIKDHESVTPWTDVQIKELERLVEEKGRKWSEIGREVNHSGEQCRAKYRAEFELQDMRKKSGHFDPEEDEQLEVEIRSLKADHDNSPEDIDVKNLAWKEIADKMDNVRTAADYARRWQRLRTIFVAKASGSESPKKDADRRRKGNIKGEAMDDENRKLMDALDKLVHPDSVAQDVVWAGVERALEFPYGAAKRRFNLLVSKYDVMELPFYEQIRGITDGIQSGNSFVPKPKPVLKRKEPEMTTISATDADIITTTTTTTTTLTPSTTTLISAVEEDDGEEVELPAPKKKKNKKNKMPKVVV
jgi:hypothetical protein